MDCLRWACKEVGTAPFPKAKEYQTLKRGAYDQEEESESVLDLYTTNDESVIEQNDHDRDLEEVAPEEEDINDELVEELDKSFWRISSTIARRIVMKRIGGILLARKKKLYSA